MVKKEEVEKLAKALSAENFEEKVEEMGFKVVASSEENSGKKKANL